jgi:tRNA(Ile)-lysidine synthase
LFARQAEFPFLGSAGASPSRDFAALADIPREPLPASMPNEFETRFATNWPPEEWREVTVLVALSGGADSVALLRAMVATKRGGRGRICAAHFNHRLRAEAEVDEEFVSDLCARLEVSCEVGRAEGAEIASAPGEGIEEAARGARYQFLAATAARLGARFITTAHTADDQAETIMHRILRGTGLAGLAGIARTRVFGGCALIRPLLGVRRTEVERYLADLEQDCRQDASNFDCRFTRNRIRHELLPQLAQEYNPQVVEAILRLGTLAGEVQSVVDPLVEQLLERHVQVRSDKSAWIDLLALEGTSPYLLRELLMAIWRKENWPLQAMGYVEWSLLDEMLRNHAAMLPTAVERRVLPGAITVETTRGEMNLKPC